MQTKTELIPVALPNGATMQVEASILEGGFEATGFIPGSFDGVIAAIDGIGMAVKTGFAKVKPTKASVELGLELAVESGQLTALLVKGSGKANLKIILTWEE